jgi:D-alanyl-lipoteichoic acid acyltransferase DltB (MBOAT superfamily)
MIFPTVEFAIFFPLVLGISWLLMPHPKLWKPFILFASYAFYAASEVKFCLLLAALTLVNQFSVDMMKRHEDDRIRKRFLLVTILFDLGVLAVFKYYGFFATEINDVLDTFGIGLSAPLVALAIPLGVSFFVFQSISRSVDVYRRRIDGGSLLDGALYLSFFPHVVAGPIVRASEFLPQLAAPRSFKNIPIGAGVGLICLGLIKKVAIADFLAREIVDPVYAVPTAYNAADVLLASYAYTAQIFCDFSGYTDIAIGVALLLGFVFPQNFHRPYGQLSVGKYWNNWHMTLSRFFRDFVYIPLGGNRRGKWINYRNLFLTMLIAGLWHGAAFTFVVWGALHGAAVAIERMLQDKWQAPRWLRWFYAFHMVVFLFIIFRSPSFAIVGDMLGQLTDFSGATQMWSFPVLLCVVLVVGLQLVPENLIERVRLRLEASPPAILGVGLAVTIMFVAATVPTQGVPPFIYFQF